MLALAADAAVRAGRLLAARRPGERPEVVETKSSPTDVVTEMDRRAEALITERIRAVRPGDAILGEESGETRGTPGAGGAPGGGPGSAAVRWIVDPLDGTVNYLYGLPDWAVSIAAEVAGTVVAGVVASPRRGEIFTAVRGKGAWVRSAPWLEGADWAAAAGALAQPDDGQGQRETAAVPLRCTRGVPLGQALVATGFGYAAGRRRIQGEVVGALLPQVRDIRRGGSAALDLCMVAAGRMDASYERGLNYWDYAAGALIAGEAGALVGGLSGRPASPSMTIAAGPGLFEELSAVLSRLNPERDA
ncbi:MAG TPA: inositol monophosphatase family protein [Streptosporangiaceae bacterium]|nr:inositol monophosphatase family protein [Streptosporangiaceae bacterium]